MCKGKISFSPFTVVFILQQQKKKAKFSTYRHLPVMHDLQFYSFWAAIYSKTMRNNPLFTVTFCYSLGHHARLESNPFGCLKFLKLLGHHREHLKY